VGVAGRLPISVYFILIEYQNKGILNIIRFVHRKKLQQNK
jgi:hypothetical protein